MKRFLPYLAILPLLLLQPQAHGLKKEFDFMGIRLGMSEKDLMAVVMANDRLKVDESRYLGRMNEPVPFIMKITYLPYIQSIYVQFYSNIACSVTVQFNPEYFDFFSLGERLQDKYGPPKSRTSKAVKWEGLTVGGTSNLVVLQLEYPSTVKVLDFDTMKNLNADFSQNIIRITNQTIIQSNKNAIMDEL